MARTMPVLESRTPLSPARTDLARHAVCLLDIEIDRVTMDQAVETIAGFVREGQPRQVATVNLDFLRLTRNASAFKETLNAVDLAVADGMPLVWASRLQGEALPGRIAGIDLVAAVCERGAAAGWRFFLLGAAPGIAERAGDAMARRWPGLHIAGTYSPPVGVWDDAEESRIRDRIRAAKPDVLLVALGAPRQELWTRENLHRLGVPVSIGIGCTLDVLAGKNRRSPAWMQRRGLEWLFRLVSEPRRLWRRYLLHGLPVFARLMLSAAKGRRHGRDVQLIVGDTP